MATLPRAPENGVGGGQADVAGRDQVHPAPCSSHGRRMTGLGHCATAVMAPGSGGCRPARRPDRGRGNRPASRHHFISELATMA